MDDCEVRIMTTKLAVMTVVAEHEIRSLYQLASMLSNEEIKVQPIQISNYLNGTRMSGRVARRFFELFNIHIEDAVGKEGTLLEQCKRGLINLKSRGMD